MSIYKALEMIFYPFPQSLDDKKETEKKRGREKEDLTRCLTGLFNEICKLIGIQNILKRETWR